MTKENSLESRVNGPIITVFMGLALNCLSLGHANQDANVDGARVEPAVPPSPLVELVESAPAVYNPAFPELPSIPPPPTPWIAPAEIEVVQDNYFTWPVPKTSAEWNNVVSVYGPRARRNGKIGFHSAIDIALTTGTPLIAVADGKIKYSCKHSDYDNCKGMGTMLKIEHADGLYTQYFHLNRIKKGLGEGSTVKRGDVIGYSGSSGVSRGPHLHFSVHKGNAKNNINPLCFFPDTILRDLNTESIHYKRLYGAGPLYSGHPRLDKECSMVPM